MSGQQSHSIDSNSTEPPDGSNDVAPITVTQPSEFSPTVARLTDEVIEFAHDQSAATKLHTDQSTQVESGKTLPSLQGFECLEVLGQGGMGVVYKARQVSLNRIVALKVVRDSESSGVLENARFIDEAEAIAAIDHPNVVRVFDYGENQGRPYLAMEYLAGGSLADQMQDSVRFGPAIAASLLEKVARGVQAAHTLGIIHRDIKPHNILLDVRGEPKVTDFGLARRSQSKDRTMSGAVLGTPQYMAPEQASGNGKHAGAAADIWALGVVLYECLTGVRPFSAPEDMPRLQHALAVMRKIETDLPKPPRSIVPAIPRDLELICLKCLEKDPRDRYETAAALADDLERFRSGETVSVRPAGILETVWKWSRRHKTLAGLYFVSFLAIIVLLSLGSWFTSRIGVADAQASAAESRAELAAAEERRAKQVAATQAYFRLMTDIRDRENSTRSGWTKTGLQAIQSLLKEELPPSAKLSELRTEAINCSTAFDLVESNVLRRLDAAVLAMHPTGDWLAIGERRAQAFARCMVYLVEPLSGKLIRTLSFPPSNAFQFQLSKITQDGPRAIAVSPDGRWLVIGARSGWLHRWDLSQPDPAITSWEGHPAEINKVIFAPDSQSFFSSASNAELKRWGHSATEPLATWLATGPIHTLIVLPGSKEFACSWDSGSGHDTVRLRLQDLKPTSPPIRLAAKRAAAIPGSNLWVVSEGPAIRIVESSFPEFAPLRQLRSREDEFAHQSNVRHLSISPEGQWLASSGNDDHVRIWDLLTGRLILDLPLELEANGSVIWNPDGKSLVIATSTRVIRYELLSSKIHQTMPLAAFARSVGFSPVGSRIASTAEAFGELHQTRVWSSSPFESINRTEAGIPFTLPAGTYIPSAHTPQGISFSADGSQLAVRTNVGITIFDVKSGSETIAIPAKDITTVVWRDQQIWSAVGRQIRSWSMPSGKPGQSWSNVVSDRLTGKGKINAVDVSQDWIIAACHDGKTRLFDRNTLDQKNSVSGKGSVRCAVFSPDQRITASGTDLGQVRVFQIPEGSILGESDDAHREAVTAMTFISNTILATGSRDGTIRFWTWKDGNLSETLRFRTSAAVLALSISPDQKRLAAAINGELGIRLWNLELIWSYLNEIGLGSSH
jgi:eukaryotic-like serine/threonine-protein kinase